MKKTVCLATISFALNSYTASVLFLLLSLGASAQSYTPGANGVLFVKKGSTGNGSSWSNAIGEMANALKFAKEANAITTGTVTQIWAAEGMYKPMYRPDNFAGPSSSRYNSFLIVPDVKLYGGFAGTETNIGQRNILQHPTILDGGDGSAYASGYNEIDNYYTVYGTNNSHIVIASGNVGNAELNGFTIQGGRALGSYQTVYVNGIAITDNQGAGLSIINASPTIDRCTFKYNWGYFGGGLSIYQSETLVTNCFFDSNLSGYYGGNGAAIYANNFSGNVRNCTFVKNAANGSFHTVFYEGGVTGGPESYPYIENCLFWANFTLDLVFGPFNYNNNLQDYTPVEEPDFSVFIDPDNNDYRLKPGVEMIDAGTLEHYPEALTDTDLYGNPRVSSGTIDVGAFEYYVAPAPCSTPAVWNGSYWGPFQPVADQPAVINGNFSSTEDVSACSLTVNSGNVVVHPGHDFNVTGAVTVNGGSLTFENNANLLQVNDVSNSGPITVKRQASMKRLDYVYWGSPVSGQDLKLFSPYTVSPVNAPGFPTPVGPSRFYTLNEATNAFDAIANPYGTAFTEAKGYMLRAPNNFNPNVNAAPQVFEGIFKGVPHNGNATAAVTTNGFGFNMLSNPYPSPISANGFLALNPGALYFWTHTSQGPGSGSNYATWTTFGTASSTTPVQSAVPNGTIQTGQGFVFLAASAGDATFTNSMRTGNNDGQFFRTDNSDKDRIWLSLSNETGMQNQILVGYMNGATDGVDISVDAKQIESGINSIASVIGEDKFNIQALAIPFSDTDQILLSFNALTAGAFTIAIDQADGIFANDQDIYIKDNLTGIIHDIKQSAYTFAADAGTVSDRFSVVFQNVSLGIEEPATADSIIAFKKDAVLNINSGKEAMKNLRLFDIRGRLVYERSNINATTTTLTDFNAAEGVLLVQVTTENGQMVTKKVVY